MAKAKDITGQKFYRLTVLNREETRGTHAMWRCQCDCGKTTVLEGTKLRRGITKSCGCLGPELSKIRAKKHGKYGLRIYKIWGSLKERCNNVDGRDYKRYGGRGIKVCEEWNEDFQAFYDWAMANGYRDDLSIDRIDVNGNYEPSNCRWATAKEQANNRRSNHVLEFNGERHTLSEWGEITGLGKKLIRDRIDKGWSVSDALTTPKIEQKGVSHERLKRTGEPVLTR